jgi:hypothetical protein
VFCPRRWRFQPWHFCQQLQILIFPSFPKVLGDGDGGAYLGAGGLAGDLDIVALGVGPNDRGGCGGGGATVQGDLGWVGGGTEGQERGGSNDKEGMHCEVLKAGNL